MKQYKIPVFRPTMPSLESAKDGLANIFNSKQVSNWGQYAQKFENIAQAYLGNQNVLAVSSCDTGLVLAIKSLDLPKGSEVLLPSFTFTSTANAVIWNDLKPIFVDIDPKTFNIDPVDVVRKITTKTKLIIGTHIFGNPCNVDELEDVAAENHLPIIFDAAHAYGSMYKGTKIGDMTNSNQIIAEVFSFSGTKLVTSGEGGLIACENETTLKKLSYLRGYGFHNDYNCQVAGLNGKLSEFNALIGTLTLPTIDEAVMVRNDIAFDYISQFNNMRLNFQYQDISGNRSSYKDFAIVCNSQTQRDAISNHLENNSIQTKKYFLPLHTTDYYSPIYLDQNMHRNCLKNTEDVASKILCLPIYNDLRADEIKLVVEKIAEVYVG